MEYLLQFKINFRKIPTVNINALCNWCAKIGWCSYELIFTCLYACSSVQGASEQFVSRVHLPFVNFALNQTQNKKI
jgi:hypothetical protein